MAHKTISDAKKNLESSITRIPQAYKDGVAKGDWKTPASSDQAETNYAGGVQKAIADKSRQKGIEDVSNEAWKKAATDKGGVRIGEGVRAGLEKYNTNFSPILSAMNSAADQAPARGIDPVENINNRLIPVVQAARKAAGK